MMLLEYSQRAKGLRFGRKRGLRREKRNAEDKIPSPKAKAVYTGDIMHAGVRGTLAGHF
jgi:hypothetical protein